MKGFQSFKVTWTQKEHGSILAKFGAYTHSTTNSLQVVTYPKYHQLPKKYLANKYY